MTPVLFVLPDDILDLVDEGAFDRNVAAPLQGFASGQQHVEELEGSRGFIEHEGYGMGADDAAEVDLDVPVFRRVPGIRRPSRGLVSVRDEAGVALVRAGLANAPIECPGIQYGIDVLLHGSGPDGPGPIQFHRAHGKPPLLPVAARVETQLVRTGKRGKTEENPVLQKSIHDPSLRKTSNMTVRRALLRNVLVRPVPVKEELLTSTPLLAP